MSPKENIGGVLNRSFPYFRPLKLNR